MYDDDVDMLFFGVPEKENMEGLLYWGGIESDKRDGTLKRICPHVLALINHLVAYCLVSNPLQHC